MHDAYYLTSNQRGKNCNKFNVSDGNLQTRTNVARGIRQVRLFVCQTYGVSSGGWRVSMLRFLFIGRFRRALYLDTNVFIVFVLRLWH